MDGWTDGVDSGGRCIYEIGGWKRGTEWKD